MVNTVKTLLKDTLYNFCSPILNRVTRFRNIHQGESCYIFGDGISVKSYDLSKFSDKITFAGNYIPFHKDFEQLDARYCIMSAPFFFSPFFGYSNPDFKDYLYRMSKLYKKKIAAYPDKDFFLNISNYPFVSVKNSYFNFINYPQKGLPAEFVSNKMNCFTGVMRHAVSLALYMGFNDIYLVGCDYTFSPTQQLHWYEYGKGTQLEMSGYEKDFFTLASRSARITTVTLNGKSDLLPYITYSEFTGAEPTFRENNLLADEETLQTLATWQGYSIYDSHQAIN